MNDIDYPHWRWNRISAHVERSSGPERTATETPPDDWKPPAPVGFAPPPVMREPQVWEGDDA